MHCSLYRVYRGIPHTSLFSEITKHLQRDDRWNAFQTVPASSIKGQFAGDTSNTLTLSNWPWVNLNVGQIRKQYLIEHIYTSIWTAYPWYPPSELHCGNVLLYRWCVTYLAGRAWHQEWMPPPFPQNYPFFHQLYQNELKISGFNY